MFYADYFHIKSPTIWRVQEKLQQHTGIIPVWYDCCINSCIAYTGQYSPLDSCPYKGCGESRWRPQLGNEKKRARKQWLYIPLIQRLKTQFNGPYAEQLTTYRACFATKSDGILMDIFDGNLYRALLEKGFFS